MKKIIFTCLALCSVNLAYAENIDWSWRDLRPAQEPKPYQCGDNIIKARIDYDGADTFSYPLITGQTCELIKNYLSTQVIGGRSYAACAASTQKVERLAVKSEFSNTSSVRYCPSECGNKSYNFKFTGGGISSSEPECVETFKDVLDSNNKPTGQKQSAGFQLVYKNVGNNTGCEWNIRCTGSPTPLSSPSPLATASAYTK